jgi:hypothetical protein
MTYETASPWRRRLATPPTPERVRAWIRDAGAVQLAAVDSPSPRLSPADAAEEILDRLLAETLPALDRAGVR